MGGANHKDAVKRIMGSALSHDLSLVYNWAGKKGPKGDGSTKLQFSNLRVAKAIKSKRNLF
jgi:hypothetical protein